MDDQFDKDLKKRISEVFENFEDTSADEGWLLLREKYPPKANRRPIIWLWMSSAAALLLLFLGILWYNHTPITNSQLTGIKKQQKNNLIPKSSGNNAAPGLKNNALINTQSQALAGNVHSPVKKITNPVQKSIPQHGQTAIVNNQNIIPMVRSNSATRRAEQSLPTTNQAVTNSKDIPQELIASTPPKTQNQDNVSPKSVDAVKTDTVIKNPDKSTAIASSAAINMLQQPNQPKKSTFADEANQGPKSRQRAKPFDKTVRFSIYATTYFNYSKGSSAEFNAGAGFSSDISLSNHLKFSTGISVAQNTLNYDNQASIAPIAAVIASATPVQKINAYAADNYRIATPTFRNYNASLVGLDIPINLKYIFDPQKSETYVSFGLSSGTFINEAYNYSYNNPAPFSSNISQVKSQSTSQSFNSFYFAKTLNFAFGISYPLSKNNKLIIEPFLKYPLDGLGAEQIRFGAGGLNLKFNFRPQRQ